MKEPLFREVSGLIAAGRREEALRTCALLAREHPSDIEVANLHAFTLLQSGDPRGAVEEATRAVKLGPHLANLHVNLARALMHGEALDPVLEALDRAQSLSPGWAEPGIAAAEACIQHGRFCEAQSRCVQWLKQFPNDAELAWTLGNALHFAGRNQDAIDAIQPMTARHPTDLRLLSALAHFSNYIPSWTRAQVFEAHRRYGRAVTRHYPASAGSPDRAPRASGRVRVGLISPDLREHSVSFFVKPLLEHYDRASIELFAYHTNAASDDTTSVLRALAEHWRPLATKNGEAAARALREDRLDVLIDLAGHTKGNSLFAMSRGVGARTATYLGYPNTTGLSAINYRLVDSHTDPEGAEAFAVETLVRLDPCFLCYSPPADAPEVTPPPSAERGSVTFGSFNTLKKLNDGVISLWAEVLKRSPGSRLVLKCHGLEEAAMQASLWARFEAQGIARERVELTGTIKQSVDHLGAYGRIDVALDTFPYHGTTTTCEALWMGVPVVSLAGSTHASRVGVSLLTNVGLADLIAHDADEFASKAAQLAHDAARRAQLRERLRGMMRASALCDGQGFARRFEQALYQMAAG